MAQAKRHILIAPLDWGLGHTTRCVPIMRHLIKNGCKLTFAGNEGQRRYIEISIPGVNTIHLEGYNVSYTRSGNGFMANIARQLPRLLQTIKAEHEWLKKVVAEHGIDGVISDNRYGLHHDKVPCVIMTHQLQPISGWGNWADSVVRKWHYRHLEKFNECWVVDTEDAPGMAGKLSHPSVLPKNAKYIGLLSQLEKTEPLEKGYLLVLLSGPEPQRTILSELLWLQVANYKGYVVFVEGNENVITPAQIPAHITYHKRITGGEVSELLSGADMVICRGGYSTIMDLVKLDKKAMLIPTPGQTEQEYLARQLSESGRFLSINQQLINLESLQEKKKKNQHNILNVNDVFNIHPRALNDWLQKL